MKKLIFCLALFFAVGKGVLAQDTTTTTKYWYYPSTNTYYNTTTHEYSYYDEPKGTWLVNVALPSGSTVDNTAEHYDVYYNGTEVWKENKNHKMKYKVRKNGTTKSKP